MKHNTSVLQSLGMIVLAVLLFPAAYKIDGAALLDRIMVPFAYMYATLSLLTGVYMLLPAGRKMFAKVEKIRQQEREVVNADLKNNTDFLILALRKAISREIPAIVILTALFLAGALTSFPALLIAWSILFLFDFMITYFYVKRSSSLQRCAATKQSKKTINNQI